MLAPIRMRTNIAGGNQQKHLSLSFASTLEELKNIKKYFFQYKNGSEKSEKKCIIDLDIKE